MSLEAVIFDFDGLLFDTESRQFAVWSGIYRDHGVELKMDDWIVCVGTSGAFDPIAHLEGLLGRRLDRAAVAALARERERPLMAALPLMPGVLDRLDEAAGRGLKTAVASSSERPWVEGMLGPRGLLPRFHVIATRGGAVRAKPEPDVYLAALAALGAPAARAVAFEDSANGVAAAKAAGLFCVAVPNEVTRRLDLSRADLIVPSLADVTLADLERRGFGGTGRRESSGGAGCRGGKPRAPAEGRA